MERRGWDSIPLAPPKASDAYRCARSAPPLGTEAQLGWGGAEITRDVAPWELTLAELTNDPGRTRIVLAGRREIL